jgi:hypothetical protein
MNGSNIEVIAAIHLPILIKLASVRETSSLEQAVPGPGCSAPIRPHDILHRGSRSFHELRRRLPCHAPKTTVTCSDLISGRDT